MHTHTNSNHSACSETQLDCHKEAVCTIGMPSSALKVHSANKTAPVSAKVAVFAPSSTVLQPGSHTALCDASKDRESSHHS